jgi:hypothetical protein
VTGMPRIKDISSSTCSSLCKTMPSVLSRDRGLTSAGRRASIHSEPCAPWGHTRCGARTGHVACPQLSRVTTPSANFQCRRRQPQVI